MKPGYYHAELAGGQYVLKYGECFPSEDAAVKKALERNDIDVWIVRVTPLIAFNRTVEVKRLA